jgi:glycosyltransferase involved in cell wall biosynthesis
VEARRHPRVAVLIATFDGEAYLAAQLDSLAAQEGVEVQVFARDDGSTDGTLAILGKYAGRWPGLAAPFGGVRLGPAASFLELLAKAPGDFDGYAFCDQDDVWLPDKLKRAMCRLNDDAEGRPGLYCSRVLRVDQDLKSPRPARIDSDGRFEHLLFENIAYGNTVVINPAARSLIAEHARTAGIIMHDWWCALVVAAFGTVVYDERPGILYRQHGGNQIGAAPGRWAEITRHVAMLWRDPRRFYPIHAQAATFLRLYGDRIGPGRRDLVQSLVASRRSLAARIAFTLSSRVVRSRRLDALASRMLILAGWY